MPPVTVPTSESSPPSSNANGVAVLERQLTATARDLVDSLRLVLNELPGAPHRQQQLARLLGLGRNVTSQLLMGARRQDPLAAVHVLPGPEGIRQFLKAAARRGAESPTIRQSEEALERYETLAHSEIGGMSELGAVIGSLVPEAREKFEASAKQAMFKNTASLRGVQVDTSLVTVLVHPAAGENPAFCDFVMLGGYFGLRRLRPSARVGFTATVFKGVNEREAGDKIDLDEGPLLSRFCSPWPLPVDATVSSGGPGRDDEDERIRFRVRDMGIGPRSAMNVVFSERYPAAAPMTRREPNLQRAHFSATVEQPSRLIVLDVLVAETLWPHARPELRLYDTTVNGMVDPTVLESDDARLDLEEHIQDLGVGATRFRLSEVPEYMEMLQLLCARSGWRVDDFRGYRCRIAHPFYGSQVSMLFDLPG